MEKLCIFCNHFKWDKEDQCGMGSTLTGPLMEGGDAACQKGHFIGKKNRPRDESDYRAIILRAAECADYDQVKT